MKRNYKVYILLIVILLALGLPSRIIPQYFPTWYILYAGDILWAALLFFSYCLVFNLSTKHAVIVALTTAYLIEISQLFHPDWLERLRAIKLFSLILGFSFLWSDLVAYTFGIGASACIDLMLLRNRKS